MKFLPITLLLHGALALALGGRCPPAGPVLPPPDIPSSYNPSNLTSKLSSLKNDTSIPWNLTTTSFSVELTSKKGTVFKYHRTAPVRSNRGGVSVVDGNTVYRVGSVSKIFPVLSLLINAPEKLDTPIGRYMPELHGVKEYEHITLRMLASQQSGVPRFGRAFDLYSTAADLLLQAGFPKPNAKDIPTCDNISDGPCNRKEFFTRLLQDKLDWLPGDKVAYSNQAYMLIGFALQNITGKPLAQILKDDITTPLKMPSTSFNAPELSKAIIPVGSGEVFMGLNLGNLNATGGLYSTPNELTTFVRSILSSTLLHPSRTRAWLKPAGFGGGYSMAVGAPWEIFRLSELTSDNRVIDVYTKSGDLPGYAAYIVVLPDYDFGVNIMASGDDASVARDWLLDLIIKELVPSLDSLARNQARKAYVGHYTTNKSSSNNTSSLDLVIDQGPGLKIKSWFNNGKSMLSTLAAVEGITEAQLDARLYPIRQDHRWRLEIEKIQTGKIDTSAPSSACTNWATVDSLRWASFPVDEFRFEFSKGIVKAVENPGLRVALPKTN